ncbi:MAG: YHS domain-containing protein [Acidimicrobiales bacterium]
MADLAEDRSLDEVAAATGVPPKTLEEWQRLGLLLGKGNRLAAQDVERLRLIVYAQRRGFDPQTIAATSESRGDMLGYWADLVSQGKPRLGHSLDEAAALAGVESAAMRRLWASAGLGDQDEVYEEDIEAARLFRYVLDAGLPEAAVVQVLRVFVDSLRRVAEAEAHLVHDYIHERLRAEGLRGEELDAATRAVSDPLRFVVEPTVLYFHSKAFERALREDFLLHLAEDSIPVGRDLGQMTAAILFVDLCGFTPMTEAMGDAAAAAVVERFSELVRKAATRHDGKIVKQIGDEFMVVFTRPDDAISFGVDIEDSVSGEPQFPALRIGAHVGDVLFREGDYVGSNVNLASRVTTEAGSHQFLITAALRDAARQVPDVSFVPAGGRPLKGISGEVELFEVEREAAAAERPVDPVCRMELDPAAAGARLRWHGTELYFCSDTCLQRFVAAPEQYPVHTQRR